MRLLVAFLTAVFLLFTAPVTSIAQQRTQLERRHAAYVKKEKHTWLYKVLHGRRDRHLKWNAGHTEFKNRTKRERRRLSRHHIKPEPDSKYQHTKKQKNKLKTEDGGNDKEKDKDKENAPEPGGDKPKDPEPDKPKEPDQPAPPPSDPAKPDEKKAAYYRDTEKIPFSFTTSPVS